MPTRARACPQVCRYITHLSVSKLLSASPGHARARQDVCRRVTGEVRRLEAPVITVA